jgi:hypothetical protein
VARANNFYFLNEFIIYFYFYFYFKTSPRYLIKVFLDWLGCSGPLQFFSCSTTSEKRKNPWKPQNFSQSNRWQNASKPRLGCDIRLRHCQLWAWGCANLISISAFFFDTLSAMPRGACAEIPSTVSAPSTATPSAPAGSSFTTTGACLASGLGVDVEVMLTRPCIFCMGIIDEMYKVVSERL